MRSACCGIFFISAGTLLFEISLTRVFSISQWYHFAFMVVSIALLGFAASGSILYLIPRIRTSSYTPFFGSILFSVSCVVGFYLSSTLDMDPYRMLADPSLLGSIALYYLLLFLPFLCAGIVISVLLSGDLKNAGTLYGSNLVGSAVGGVLVFCFSFCGERILLLCSLLGILASLFFSHRRNQRIMSILVCFFLLLLPGSVFSIPMSPYKDLPMALNYPGARIIDTGWNSISRVDVVESPVRRAPGLSLHSNLGLPPGLGLTVDGDTFSPLIEPDPSMEFLPTAAAYVVPRRDVLIINPQPLDVATAKYFGARVTVAQGNSLLSEMVEAYSSVYDGVVLIQDDGRSYLAGHEGNFDLIQISLTESLFASSVGLYGFNESYLFTREAFEDYYSHLTDDGILLITRWLVVPPRELPKIVSLVVDTVENPREHLVIFRTYSTTTLLLRKTPFNEEIQALETFCREKGFDLIWTPVITQDQVNRYNQFEEPYFYQLTLAQLQDNDTVKREYLFNIASPTDNDPFFFNFFQWTTGKEIHESLGGRFQPFFEGGFMAVLILVQAAGLSFLFVAAPLVRGKGAPTRFTLGYFSLIGLGFMFVEISLMQQIILFIGQPTYSMILVLGVILFFSGIGSVYSSRISFLQTFFGLAVILGILVMGLSPLIHMEMGISLHHKIAILVGILSVLAFFMGIPFPTGLKISHPDEVPYAWCINGCASVCASVLSILIAVSCGFRCVLLCGLLSYTAALFMGWRAMRGHRKF